MCPQAPGLKPQAGGGRQRGLRSLLPKHPLSGRFSFPQKATRSREYSQSSKANCAAAKEVAIILRWSFSPEEINVFFFNSIILKVEFFFLKKKKKFTFVKAQNWQPYIRLYSYFCKYLMPVPSKTLLLWGKQNHSRERGWPGGINRVRFTRATGADAHPY